MSEIINISDYTVKPKIIQTPDIIFYIFLLVGAGHYSSFL